MDDWVGKHLFSLMGSAKPLDMSPKRRTTTTTKVICIFTPKQLLRAAAELQEGGWRSRNTYPPYHPEIHYGSPVWVQCRECNHRAPVWRVLKVLQENQEDTWQGPHVQTAVTTTSRGSSCLMSHNNGVMWGISLFYSRMIASGDLQLERFEIGSWKFQQGNSDLQCSINCINKSPTQFCLLGGLLLWKEGLS